MIRIIQLFLVLMTILLPVEVAAKLQGKARVDSLLTELVKAKSAGKNDTLMIGILDDLAYAYRTIDPEKGIRCAMQELALAEGLQWQKAIADAYVRLQLNYQFKYDYPNALDYGAKALKIYNLLSDKNGLASVNAGLANVYSQMGDQKKGLEYNLNALKFFEDGNDKRNAAITQGNIGNIYQMLNDYTNALLYDLNALKNFEDLDDKSGIARNLGNLGNIYLQLGDYNQALSYNFKALNQFTELGEKNGQGLISGNIGEVYMAIYKDTTDTIKAGTHLPGNKKEVLALAISYLKEGLAICEEINLLGGVIEFSRFLSEAHVANGNHKEALRITKLYSSVKESLYSADNMRMIALYDGKKEKEIRQKELEVQQLQLLAARNKERYYLAALLLLFIATVGLYTRFRRARKVRLQLEDKTRTIEAEKETAHVLRLQAEESEKFSQQFLTNMSHEIRTPMNAVNGMTELLLDKNPRPDQVHFLKIISRSSDILLHIINDILDLSKIEAGHLQIETVDFSLSEAVNQVKETLIFRAEEKGLLLYTKIDPAIPEILKGDPFRLNQILINLVGNAIKFTEKGSVLVEVMKGATAGMNFSIAFRITDTGVGIPADKLETLFENFSQVQKSDSRIYGGSGLGLAICRQLIELLGGNIHVSSNPGGTTFSFELPYQAGTRSGLLQKSDKEQRADGTMLNGLRILLVDDNEYNRMVAVETLRSKADVNIDEAINGKEAIDMVLAKDYDVVLMDIQMPIMNGLDATVFIRRHMASPKNKVPIVALTASLLHADTDKCINAGMNSYLPKPFKAWQLITTIAMVTGREMARIRAQREKDRPVDALLQPTHKDNTRITDLDHLEDFCDGEPERMKKFIVAYIASVPAFVEKIDRAMKANDYAAIATQLHAMKPRWRLMGMITTVTLGSNIEQQIHDDTISETIENLNKLINNVTTSATELADFKQ